MRRIISVGILVSFLQSATGQELLAAKISTITDRAEYKHGRWGILVVNAETGDVLFARNPDQMFVPASTTKLFTCAAVLAELGADYRFKTRVVANGKTENGVLDGDLILIASGDLTLGGRTRPDGAMAFISSDHTYADAISKTAKVTETDPLAGLDELARQIRSSGITRVRGEVLIDDRLFDVAEGSGSGPGRIVPIVVNDNVIDFVIHPGRLGESPTVTMRPQTSFVQWESRATTAGSEPNIDAVTVGPRKVLFRGNVPDKSAAVVRIHAIEEPSAFARCLFIECLIKAGVEVTASAIGTPKSSLPDRESVAKLSTIAEFVSPPFAEAVKVTLKVSHNLYASTMPLLIAAKNNKRTLGDGMKLEKDFLSRLGIDGNSVSFAGGAGGSRADSTTPRATVSLLRLLAKRPDYSVIEEGLPILGVDGTLSDVVAATSPARGHVRAKTGTLSYTNLLTGGSILRSKALAGTMTTKAGRNLVFAMFVNDVPLAPGVNTAREGKALGELCETIYQFAP